MGRVIRVHAADWDSDGAEARLRLELQKTSEKTVEVRPVYNEHVYDLVVEDDETQG